MRGCLVAFLTLISLARAAKPAHQLSTKDHSTPLAPPDTPPTHRRLPLQLVALTLASAAALRRLLAEERRQAGVLAAAARAAATRRQLHRQWSAFEASVGAEAAWTAAQAQEGVAVGEAAEEAARRAAAEAEARSRYTLYARTTPERPGVTPEGSPRAEVERLLRLRSGPPRPLATLRLGLGGVSPSSVARAYRRLSARIHPDKNRHPGAAEAQAVLNAARDALLRVGVRPEADGSASESEPET